MRVSRDQRIGARRFNSSPQFKTVLTRPAPESSLIIRKRGQENLDRGQDFVDAEPGTALEWHWQGGGLYRRTRKGRELSLPART